MFDYITDGPPIIPIPTEAALVLDQANSALYVNVPRHLVSGWVAIFSSIDSIQSISVSVTLGFAGAGNTLVKGTSGAGGITLTLISAVGIAGRSMKIIKIDSGVGAVTITPNGTQNINGVNASYLLTNQYQYVVLESDGANWFVIGNN